MNLKFDLHVSVSDLRFQVKTPKNEHNQIKRQNL